MSEKDTIQKIREGDIKTFEDLFNRLYRELCLFACRYVKDMDSAGEIVQDLFFKIWSNHKDLTIRTSVKSYLYRSVYNNSIQYLRSREPERDPGMIALSEGMNSNPLTLPEQEELENIVQNTLEHLPERAREIFILNRYEGLKYREIAVKLSISIKTVEANMAKALKLFRENLKEYI